MLTFAQNLTLFLFLSYRVTEANCRVSTQLKGNDKTIYQHNRITEINYGVATQSKGNDKTIYINITELQKQTV